MKANIIYWSGMGSTERMAELIAEGAREAGLEAELIKASDATDKDVIAADYVFLGSPAMGAEVIDEYDMEPLVESIKDSVKGRKLGLFGSYEWGVGQWMEDWVRRMEGYGALVHGEGCINKAYPASSQEERIRDYGRSIVE